MQIADVELGRVNKMIEFKTKALPKIGQEEMDVLAKELDAASLKLCKVMQQHVDVMTPHQSQITKSAYDLAALVIAEMDKLMQIPATH